MSREAVMKFRERVLADEELQRELLEIWNRGDAAEGAAWVADKDFTVAEIAEFLDAPGADLELSDFELELVAGGQFVDREHS